MNEPLRITIQTFGGRAHQSGQENGRSLGYYNLSEKDANPHGPVIEHVRDGKPVTPLGKKLLGVAG